MGSTKRDFRKCWGAYRERVAGIYGEFSKAEKALESHNGSAYGDEQHAKNKERYDTSMAAARAVFSDEVNGVLQAMAANIDYRESIATPPNDEQLRLLRTVELMSDMDMDTFNRVAKAMEHNSLALRALHSLASTRMPGVKLPEFRGEADAARAQVRELTREAQNLIRWDGATSRGDALTADLNSKGKTGIYRGLPTAEGRMFNASAAASLDPTAPEFFKEVLGTTYDAQTFALVEELKGESETGEE